MQSALALLQVLTLCVLLNVSSLVACPFLQPENPGGSHQCCRNAAAENKAPEPKCPIAPTIDTCPLNLTEAKLGTQKGKADSLYPPAPVAGPLPEDLRTMALAQTVLSPVLDHSNTFLKLRVLRI